MLLAEILAQLRSVSGDGEIRIPQDWMQGRSAFGGLQTALLAQAMRDVVRAQTPLRTLQVVFVAPAPHSEALQIQTRLLRQGRSAAQVEGRLMLNGETLCIAIGVFGAARESSVRQTPASRVVTGSGPELPFIEGLLPNFTQHYAMRWLQGGVPFSGAAHAESVIELGYRDQTPLTEAHVIALADAPPPAVLSLLKNPANGSSLTWTLEFLSDRLTGLPASGWCMDLTMIGAGDGYTQQSGLLRSPSGKAVALSRQTTVVFA